MLSPADESTSEIIDAISNAKYVFLDVSVKFSILLSLRFLSLRRSVHLMDSASIGKYDHQEATGDQGREHRRVVKSGAVEVC